MARHIAFLRAINVGGRTATMDRLKGIFRRAGCTDVATFLSSGNVVFTTSRRTEESTRTHLACAVGDSLGFEVEVFLRTPREVAAIVAAREIARGGAGASAINVALLHAPLDAKARRAVEALASDVDRFAFVGREMVWFCAREQSESEFCNTVFERTSGVRSTFRSLSTLDRLCSWLEAGPSTSLPPRARRA